MAILNPDGSPYTVLGALRAFDPAANSATNALFNSYDAQVIQINGTPLYYYEVILDSNNIDPLYREARGKLWSQFPSCFYAVYDPITSQNFMNVFGVDSPDDMVFMCNYDSVLSIIGHKPVIGSRLFSPHRSGENWILNQVNQSDWRLWGEIRMELICTRFQESLSTQDGAVTQNEVGVNLHP